MSNYYCDECDSYFTQDEIDQHDNDYPDEAGICPECGANDSLTVDDDYEGLGGVDE